MLVIVDNSSWENNVLLGLLQDVLNFQKPEDFMDEFFNSMLGKGVLFSVLYQNHVLLMNKKVQEWLIVVMASTSSLKKVIPFKNFLICLVYAYEESTKNCSHVYPLQICLKQEVVILLKQYPE